MFDPDGRLLGTVRAPPGLRVTGIENGYVVGVWKDELDVEYVRVYRLQQG